jgi:hypothetical protein
MLQDFSKSTIVVVEQTWASRKIILRRLLMALILPAWIYVSFLAAQMLTIGLVWLIDVAHLPIRLLNENILATILAAFIYLATLGLAIGLPWLIKKKRVSLLDIGLQRLPSLSDIGLAPAGLIVYVILSSLLMLAASALFPWFDAGQIQDTGFSQLATRYEYILAFVTLVVVAPVAEEVLFRGYLLGKLKRFLPIWVAIIITSLLFAAVHGAWNLAIDTFALSIVLCVLRQTTGSLWASILLHMIKNGIAFYLLFINPLLLHTLGG